MSRPALVFDLDGTLVDTAPDLAAATNAVLGRHGRPPVSLDQLRAMVGQGARKLIARGFERTGTPLSDDALEPLYEQFIAYYQANIATNSQPYPGIVALLDRARAEGVALAVCTNKLEALAVRLLDELGLSGSFGAIIGPDTIGIAKPDPAPLMTALERIGGDPARAVMIGDSATDINTAKAAGIPCIAVTFGYTEQPVSAFAPDHAVDHVDEIWPLAAGYLGLSA